MNNNFHISTLKCSVSTKITENHSTMQYQEACISLPNQIPPKTLSQTLNQTHHNQTTTKKGQHLIVNFNLVSSFISPNSVYTWNDKTRN